MPEQVDSEGSFNWFPHFELVLQQIVAVGFKRATFHLQRPFWGTVLDERHWHNSIQNIFCVAYIEDVAYKVQKVDNNREQIPESLQLCLDFLQVHFVVEQSLTEDGP